MFHKLLLFFLLFLVVTTAYTNDAIYISEKLNFNKSSESAEYLGTESRISLINYEGNFDKEINGVYNAAPRQAVIQALVEQGIDHSDFVVFFTQFPVESGEADAFYFGIKNDVSGIGLPLFNNQNAFGSNRLQGIIDMTEMSDWNWDTSDPEYDALLDTLVHEVMHRWGPAITYDEHGQGEELLLGRGGSHWNYFLNSHASVMYGSLWTEMNDGSFKSVQSRHALSPLDLYLMGMKPAASVPDFFVIENGIPGDRTDFPPNDGTVVTGNKKSININDVIAAEGVRSPSFDESQHQFDMHFVIVKRSSQEVSDQDFGRLLTLQKQFQNRFQADTAGVGSIEYPSDELQSGVIDILSYDPVTSAAYSENQAIQFLYSSQISTRAWEDKAATAIRDTVSVLQSMQILDQTVLADRARVWLKEQTAADNDQAAWLLLSGVKEESQANALRWQLISGQNEDGGWGLEKGDASNPYDTALVLLSLKSAFGSEYIIKQETLDYLRGTLNSDFGAGFSEAGSSAIAATAKTIQAMNVIGGFDTEVNQLADYLISQQSNNGSIGSLQETLIATGALMSSNAPDHVSGVNLALDFIGQSQSVDDSFEGSVFSTAVAARLLSGEQRPNFKPIRVELGQQAVAGEQVLIKATLINNGQSRNESTTVGLIHNSTLVVTETFEQWPSGQEQVAEMLFDTTGLSGAHSITIMADAEELVPESNEHDNEMVVSLDISAPSSMPELAFRRAESQYQPSQFDALPFELTADAVVQNLSTQGVNDLSVGLYRKGPSADLILISEQIHAVDAGQTLPVSFNHIVTSADGDLEFMLILDHQQLIEEVSEQNNIWQLLVAHQPSIDLVITMDDVNVPGQLVVGEQQSIDFNFSNTGTLPSPGFYVEVQVDDGQNQNSLYQIQVPEMSGGETLNRQFFWTPQNTGSYDLEFTIDTLDSVAEVDETNNTTTSTVVVVENTLSNIKIDDAVLLPTPGLTGEDNQLQVTISNDSSTQTGAFTVHLSEQFTDGNQILLSATTVVSGVAASSTAQYVIDIPQATQVGDTTFIIHIDAGQEVNEFNENDNLLIKEFRFLSKPDAMATPAALSLNPSQPVAGANLELQFSVSNLGEQPLNNLTVDWYALSGSQAPEWIGQTQIIEVAGGASEATVLNHMMPVDNQITAFQIVLDQAEAIEESNENNNQATQNIQQQDQTFYLTDDIFSPNGDGIQDTTQLIFNSQTADHFSIVIYDFRDRVVRTFAPTHWHNIDKGDVIWDGRNEEGNIVTDGSYRITLAGEQTGLSQHLSATIDTNRTPMLETLINDNGIHYDLSCLTNSTNLYGEFTHDGKYLLTNEYLDLENETQKGLFKFKTDASKVESILPSIISDPTYTQSEIKPIADGSVFVRSYEGIDKLFKINPESGQYLTLNTSGLEDFHLVEAHDDFALVRENYANYYQIYYDGFTAPHLLEFSGEAQNVRNLKRQGHFWVYQADSNGDGGLFISPLNNPSVTLNLSGALAASYQDISTLQLTQDKLWVYSNEHISHYVSDGDSLTTSFSEPQNKQVLRFFELERNYLFVILDEEFRLYSNSGSLLDSESHSLGVEKFKQSLISEFGSLDSLIAETECGNGVYSFDDISGLEINLANLVNNSVSIDELYIDFGLRFSFSVAVDTGPNGCGVITEGQSFFVHDSEGFPSQLKFNDSGFESISKVEGPIQNAFITEQLSNYFSMGGNGLLKRGGSISPVFPLILFDDYFIRNRFFNDHITKKLLLKTNSSPQQNACKIVGSESTGVYQSKDNLTAFITVKTSDAGMEIIGSAYDANFSHYEIRARLLSAAGESWQIIHTSEFPVFDKAMNIWTPERKGSYQFEIIAYDHSGNVYTDRAEAYYGQGSRAIKNIQVYPQYFSPNGDGRKDQLYIEYDVNQATEVLISVSDSDRNIVYQMTEQYSSPQNSIQLNWNGLAETGEDLVTGAYRIDVNEFSFHVSLDKELPGFKEDRYFKFTSSEKTALGFRYFPLVDYYYDFRVPISSGDIPFYGFNPYISTSFLSNDFEQWDVVEQTWQAATHPYVLGYDQFNPILEGELFRRKLSDQAENISYSPTFSLNPPNYLFPFSIGYETENHSFGHIDFPHSELSDVGTIRYDQVQFLINKPVLFLQTFSTEAIIGVKIQVEADGVLVDEIYPEIISRTESEKYFSENETISGLDLPLNMFPILQKGKRYYGLGLALNQSDFEHDFSEDLVFNIVAEKQSGQVIYSRMELLKRVIVDEDLVSIPQTDLLSQNDLSSYPEFFLLEDLPALADKMNLEWKTLASKLSPSNHKNYILKYYFGKNSEKLVTNHQLDVFFNEVSFNELNVLPVDDVSGQVDDDYFHLALFEIDSISCKELSHMEWTATTQTGKVDKFKNGDGELGDDANSKLCILPPKFNQTYDVGGMCDASYSGNTNTNLNLKFDLLSSSEELALIEIFGPLGQENPPLLWSDTNLDVDRGELVLDLPLESESLFDGLNQLGIVFTGVEGSEISFVTPYIVNKSPASRELVNTEGQLFCGFQNKLTISDLMSVGSIGFQRSTMNISANGRTKRVSLKSQYHIPSYLSSNKLYPNHVDASEADEDSPIDNSVMTHKFLPVDIGLYEGEATISFETHNLYGRSSCHVSHIEVDTQVAVQIEHMNRIYISPNGDGVNDEARVGLIHAEENLNLEVNLKHIEQLASFELLKGESREYLWDGHVNVQPLADGNYQLEMLARDSCEQELKDKTLVVIDTVKPVFTFELPLDQEQVPGIFEVQVRIDELNLDEDKVDFGYRYNGQLHQLEFELDELPSSEAGDYLLTSVVNLSGLPLDTYELVVEAVDLAGNEDEQSIFVHRVEPHEVIWNFDLSPKYISPDGDDLFEILTVDLGLNKRAQVTVEVLTEAEQLVTTLVNDDSMDEGSHSLSWAGLDGSNQPAADGSYLIRVSAYDSDIPAAVESLQLPFAVDTTLPVLVYQPADSVISGEGMFKTLVTEDHVLSTQFWLQPQSPLSAEFEVYSGGVSGELDLFDLGTLDEGLYQLRAEIKDRAGHTLESTHSFTVDNTAAVVSWIEPENEAVIGGESVDLNVSIDELHFDSGSIDGSLDSDPPVWQNITPITELVDGSFIHEWPVDIEDGVYLMRALALDQAGHETEVIQQVTIDRTPPVAVISSPSSPSMHGPQIIITGTVTDANLSEYQLGYRFSGESDDDWRLITVGVEEKNNELLFEWSHDLPSGDYQIRLLAKDVAEQETETVIDINIDVSPPPIPSPFNAELQAPNDVIITWGAVDAPDLAGYNVYRGGVRLNNDVITTTSLTDTDLADGEYSYWVVAVDQTGNASEATEAVQVMIDTTPPDVLLLTPINQTTVSSEIVIKGSASSSSDDFKRADLYLRHTAEQAPGQLIYSTTLAVNSQLLTTIDSSTLISGNGYIIRWQAEDLSGNFAAVEHQITIDNDPPTAPLNLAFQLQGLSDVDLNWTANSEGDLAGYVVFRNDAIISGQNIVNGTITETNYLDVDVPDGEHVYHVVAIDMAGNISTSSNTVTVNINRRAPDAWFVEPVQGQAFETAIRLLADSEDTDIVGMLFEYHTGNGMWTVLEDDLEAPFDAIVDPQTLNLSYGDIIIRVTARDQGGQNDATPDEKTISYTDLTPPTAVENLTHIVNGGDVMLTWQASTADDLDQYELHRKQLAPVEESEFTLINFIADSEVSYTDSGLTDGVYQYRIHAVDGHDNLSNASDSDPATIWSVELAQPFTPLLGEIEITFDGKTPQAGVIELSWQNSGGLDNSQSLNLQQADFFSTPALPLLTGDNSLSVVQVDEAGNRSRTTGTTVQKSPEPPMPVNPQSQVNGYDLSLSWQAPEVDTAGYIPYLDGQPTLEEARVIGDLTFLTSSNNFASFYAIDGDENTSWSPYWSDVNNGNPTYYQLNFNSPRWITGSTIHWEPDYHYNGLPANPSHYQVQYLSSVGWLTLTEYINDSQEAVNLDTDVPYLTTAVRIWMPLEANNYDEIRLVEWQINEQPLLTTTSYDATLSDGVYQIQVSAINAYGFESELTATQEVTVGDVEAPDAVTLSGHVFDTYHVDLSWSASASTDVANYRIFRNGELLSITTDASQLTHQDLNLSNGIYVFQVAAVDAAGNQSALSNEVELTISRELIAAPENLSITAAIEGGVLKLVWDEVMNPYFAYYQIHRSTSPNSGFEPVAQSNTSSWQDQVVNGIRYYYYVTAVDDTANESEASNIADGIALDLQAPQTPVLLTPVAGGSSLDVTVSVADIAGLATESHTVDLYHDGVWLDQVNTYTDFTVVSTEYGNYFSDVQISFGDWLAYYNGGIEPVELYNTITTDNVHVSLTVQNDDDFWWSHDGQVLYVIANEGGNERLYEVSHDGSYQTMGLISDRIDTVSVSADGKQLVYTGNGVNPDTQVNEFGFWHLVLQTQVLTAISLPQNVVLSHEAIEWMSDDAIVFINFPNQAYNYGVLWRYDLNNQTLEQLDDETARRARLVSHHSKEYVYYENNQGGREYISRIRLSDLTESSYYDASNNVAFPAVGDDPDFVFAAIGYGDHALLNIATGLVVKLFDSIGNEMQSIWLPDGRIKATQGNRQHMFMPPGYFEFNNVALNAGVNEYYVIGKQENSLESEPSESIWLNLLTTVLPDLAVEKNGIHISPQSLGVSETALGALVVRNSGQVAVDDAEIYINLIYPDLSVTSILSSPVIISLDAGEILTLNFALNQLEQEGEYLIQVAMDPNQNITEVNESNNTASQNFWVLNQQSPYLEVQVSDDRIYGHESLNAELSVFNPSGTFTGQVVVTLTDSDGFPSNLTNSYDVDGLEELGRWEMPLSWSVDSLFAGEYLLQVQLLGDEGEEISLIMNEITLIDQASIQLNTGISPAPHLVGENISFSAHIDYLEGNSLVNGLLLWSVVNDSDQIIWQKQQNIGQLTPGDEAQFVQDWQADGSGAFRLMVEFSGHTPQIPLPFTVNTLGESVQLLGQLQLSPALLSLEENQIIHYQLENTGSVDLTTVPVRLAILDENMNQALIQDDRYIDLNVSAQHSEQISLDTRILSVDRYVLVLTADLSTHGLGWVTLDHLSFDTLDEQAPDVVVISPMDQGIYQSDITAYVDVTDSWSGIDAVSVAVDSDAAQSMQAQIGSSVFETYLAGLTEGVHQLSWQATDKAGNQTQLSTQLTVDVSPPEISIQGIVDQGLYAAAVTAEVMFSDLHLESSRITLNGVDYISGTQISEEGGHLLMASAIDAAGNRKSAQRRFTIDTTAPEVIISHPLHNSETMQESTSVIGQSEAGATVFLSLNGQNWQVVTDHTGTFTFDLIPLQPGSNNMILLAQDVAMNIGSDSQLTVVYTAPVTLSGSILAPSPVVNGDLAAVTITINNNSQQDVVQLPTQVRLNDLNDELLASQDYVADIPSGSDYEQSWQFDTSALRAGDRRLSLWVELSGQWQLLAEQLITLRDETPPVILIDQPQTLSSYGPELTMRITVNDAHSDVADVAYQLNQSGQWLNMGFDGVNHVSDVTLAHGAHQVRFQASDSAGNLATENWVDFDVDAQAPEITIVEPGNGLITNQNITIDYWVTDEHNHSHEARLNGQAINSGHLLESEGSHELVVTAGDEFNNESRLTHQFTIDKTAPVITVTSPADGSQVSIPVFDLSGEMAEPGQVTVLLNGQTHDAKANSEGLFNFNNLSLEPGINALEITAIDVAGNVSDVVDWSVEYMAYGAVYGTIWHDLNGNGSMDEGEAGMAGIDVALLVQAGSDYATTTNSAGQFSLPQVIPGEYQMLINDLAITNEWQITTQNHPINLNVMTDGEYQINWGLNRKQPIITSHINAADSDGRLLILTDPVTNTAVPNGCQGISSWRVQSSIEGMAHLHNEFKIHLFNDRNQVIQTEQVHWVDLIDGSVKLVDEQPANQNINLIIHPPTADRISVSVVADQSHYLNQNLRIEAEISGHKLISSILPASCELWSEWGQNFADWQLIDLSLYPQQDSDDPDSNSASPMVVQQQLLLTQLLDDHGWAYQLTDDVATFNDAVGEGEFVAYLVLAENLTLDSSAVNQLNHAVSLGDGLLMSSQDVNLANGLQQLIGVSLAGNQSAAAVEVTDATVLTAGTVTLTSGEAVLQMQATAGHEVALFSGVSASNNDAIVSHEDGLGQTLFYGFDVLLEATSDWGGDGFYQWIIDGIAHVIRPDRGLGLGKARLVQLTLTNQSQAVSGHVQVNLPQGVTLAHSPLETTQNAEGFSFDYQLTGYGSEVFDMWLVVNESPATVSFDVHVPGYQQPLVSDQITLTAGVVPDLHAFVTNCQLGAKPGQGINYQFRIENRGNTAINGALADFTLNHNVDSAIWQCSGEGGGSCNVTQGNGNIFQQTVNLPTLSAVTFDITTAVTSDTGSQIEATGVITMPQGIDDMNVVDNQASDSDVVYHFVYKNGFECAAPTGSMK